MPCLRPLAALLCLLAALSSARAAADGPALWYVAGRHGHGVYLFGSVHVLKPGDFTLSGRLAQAYAAADAIVFEIDLEHESPAGIAATARRLGTDPRGRSLDELMGADAAEAHRLAAQLGIELAPLATMEPWFAALAVTSDALSREGYVPAAGVEQTLEARAVADRKQVLGLETAEQQFAALDALSPALQRQFLLTSLDEAGRADEEITRLLAAWRAGDEPALAAELKREFAATPALYQSLLVQRNRRWAREIAALLDDDRSYLVVVGALHLVGPDGLPPLLRAAGWQVLREP